jgi:hypothetical protein
MKTTWSVVNVASGVAVGIGALASLSWDRLRIQSLPLSGGGLVSVSDLTDVIQPVLARRTEQKMRGWTKHCIATSSGK